ncbi:MAG TPA: S8 family serine peptidase [Mycobacteriales bacterium]|nr:S8 family serine peptidase [Mycobacteriales bacterium]
MSRPRAAIYGGLIAVTFFSYLHISTAGAAIRTAPAPAAVPASDPLATGDVVVGWRTGVTETDKSAALHGLGASVAHRIDALGVQVLHVPAGAEAHVVAALLKSGRVTFAERDAVVHGSDVTPNDPYWAKQTGEAKLHAPAAWSTSTGSSAITVAVLDSGLTTSQVEYAGRVVPGYNAITGTSDVTDDNSHGSAATSIALAAGNNGTSIAGLCWQCKVMPVKVLDANATGTDSTVAAGVTWAVDHGAKVLNLSLGGTSTSTVLSNAIAYANSHGALVVAAAGNNSSTAPFYPAAYPGVLAVAATDTTDTLYSYSDSGSWVDVAAPGSNYGVWPSGSVFSFGGTSSASPVVAGLAGLLWSAAPTATAADIQAALTSTAVPISGGTIASGRVDAAAAMAKLTGGAQAPPSPSPSASPSPSSSPSPSASPSVAPSASPSSSPSPSLSPSPSSSPSASPSSSTPSTVTTSTSGSLPKGTASSSYTTSGGPASVTLTSSSSSLTVTITAGGKTLASGTGTAGLTVSATVPSGSFTVTVTGANKAKYGISVTRAA